MISIIICSRNKNVSDNLLKNIVSTIGCNHELVVIDNSTNAYSIFQAYNEGVRRAKGDVLCFMHEDILFRSDNWGCAVAQILRDKSIGLVGISGCHFLPSVPLYWVESPFITSTNIDVVDETTYEDHEKKYMTNGSLVDVVACDGQWFCVPRFVFESVKFDDSTFDGFHMYDMDICMQINECGYRVCVTDDILVEHHSRGNFDNSFEKSLNQFYKKWESSFPVFRGIDNISQRTLENINSLYISNSNLYQETQRLVRTKNYKLGYYLLWPYRKLRHLL